jgi:hypothetical protein
MDIEDINALVKVKQHYGGRIKILSNGNAIRYRLIHKKGLIRLLNSVNGYIRHPGRLLQFSKLCLKYNIKIDYSKKLLFNDG